MTYPRYIALDIGKKRTGVATSDYTNKFVTKTWEVVNQNHSINEYVEAIIKSIEFPIKKLIIGYPYHLKEKYTHISEIQAYIQDFLTNLCKLYPELNYEIQNEASTTKIAKDRMINYKFSFKAKKEYKNKMAAAIILELFLETI